MRVPSQPHEPATGESSAAMATRVLRILARRMGVSELAAELPDGDRGEISAALEELKARRVLFGERDRFMSIAIDRADNAADRCGRDRGHEPDRMLSVAM
jgi:hypothetical protein